MMIRDLLRRMNDLPDLPEEGPVRGLHLSWLGCLVLALGGFGCWVVFVLVWVGG